MVTDIDRLHDVVENGHRYRGDGGTFARCHELAGNIEVGNMKNIVCRVTKMQDVDYLFPMIQDVFMEHGLDCEFRRYEIRCGDKRILFIPEFEIHERTRGLDCHLISMGHWD